MPRQRVLNYRLLIHTTYDTYRISSYKALPRIIPATLIMPAVGTLLCWWNLVISNNTRPWRPNKKLKHAGLIWGNTVHLCCLHSLYPQGTEMLRKSRILTDFFTTSDKSCFSVQNSVHNIKDFVVVFPFRKVDSIFWLFST